MKKDHYQTITDSVIEALEAVENGTQTIPGWVKPWASIGAPRNAFTNRPYRGLNVILLSFRMTAHNWDDARFATFNQIRNAGGNVIKGEKGTTVVLWKFFKTIDKNTGKEKTKPMLRIFTVFNVKAQSEGIELKTVELPNTDNRREELDQTFADMGAEIRHGGGSAFYKPSEDYIGMPVFEAFHSADDYYSTLAHEYIHWTGSEKRLNRDQKNFFGSTNYAFEELVAELGNAFISRDLGINGKFQENHLAYIKSWIKCMKDNNRAIFRAASLAEKATKYLLKMDTTEETTETEEQAV